MVFKKGNKYGELAKGKHNHSGENNPMFGKKQSEESTELLYALIVIKKFTKDEYSIKSNGG